MNSFLGVYLVVYTWYVYMYLYTYIIKEGDNDANLDDLFVPRR